MPVYNKLVRDKIPAIIESAGKGYRTKQLDEVEYIKELKIKLTEEIAEYQEATTDGQAIEELADVLEIMHSLAKVHGANFEEVEAIRQKKAEKQGGFQDKIFLIDVDDE
ncbi:nucleoside triphosphate pyrophosphohydrolase [Alkalihalobacillus sp. BA299]|uniref:nucleoside triphosphate pyrophosphohydrolase n=1 Tax=Alkalihalobacillus sp. BA299 TaxID=2815938 RepID=UPI001AD9E74B|nr:nucleoside triphosphate pyrophosphohydrolase [Alkalihalobacillus sp. BA299]